MNLRKKFKNDIILQLIILLVFSFTLFAKEVKIISKVNNEIITNIDVEEEYKYLITLNKSLKEINKDQVLTFAKDSLVKEMIKKIEILKFYELNQKNETVDFTIQNIYKKLGINSEIEFGNYLKKNDLNYKDVYRKLEIEAVWNQMIYSKFKDKIIINKKDLKEKVLNNKNKVEALLLSEIIIDLKNKSEIKNLYDEITESIANVGFKATAIKYSISSSKTNSGSLGWINKNSLSNEIQREMDSLKIGEITKPILISSGILVLKLDDKKFVDQGINIEDELQKMIDFEMNNQLNNFSNIYFNKIKNNLLTNEY
tara:strand:+ start:346 stop:1284 length:939 start_codon:yes stop_codon:yes gene_type:complete